MVRTGWVFALVSISFCFGWTTRSMLERASKDTVEPVVLSVKGPAMYEYRATIDRVIDGDTVDTTMSLGFDTYRKERFRILGIDAWEKNTKVGKEALAFAKNLIEGKTFIVKTTKDKKDKYGRYLVAITLADGKDFGQLMIEKKYAVPYDGGKKTLPQK